MQSVDQAHRKRLAFVEEIRDRQRSSIKESIKLSFQHSQLFKHLMQDPSANIKDLYLLITNQKQYEVEVVQYLLVWLPSHEIILNSKEQAYYWTIILTVIVDHQPQATSFILNTVFQKLFNICDEILNHDVVCILLTASLTVCKRQDIASQEIIFYIQILLNRLSGFQVQAASLFEVRFYHCCFRYVPGIMFQHTSGKFIEIIVQEFRRAIDDKEMLGCLVQILVSITFHFDESINAIAKNEFLPEIKFKLQVLDLQEYPQLVHDLCVLICNAILSLHHVDIEILTFVSTLLPLFNEESKYLGRVKKTAMKTFLLIVFHVGNDPEQRDYLREVDAIGVIISIMRDYGEAYPEILQDCMEALHTLFQLCQNHADSYQICFKHKGGYEVLQHYPEWHDRLIQMHPQP